MQTKKLNPKMLALAREVRSYSQTELADLAVVSRSNITKFEQDNLQLSEAFIKNIINVLQFPEGFFYTDAEILPPAIYRRRENVPMKLLTHVDALINVYQLGINRLLQTIQYTEPKLPLLALAEIGTPNDAAHKLRKAWKITKGAIGDLTQTLEEHGVITVPVDFGTERIDSRSILIENKFPVIFYNKKLLGDRLRFTLAHGLGHLVMHTRSPLIGFDNLSHEANVFAAEFLMPKEDILKELKDIDMDTLAALKGKWKVSMHALLYRAEDLGAITENQKRYIINRFNDLKIRRREPKELDLAIERGTLLRDLITNYRTKQKMNVKQIAEFFYMYEEEFLFRYN